MSEISLKFLKNYVREFKERRTVVLSESEVTMERNLKIVDLKSSVHQKELLMNFRLQSLLSKMVLWNERTELFKNVQGS